MQNFKYINTTEFNDSTFREQAVIGIFDLKRDHIQKIIQGSFELPEKWNVGLIVGKSGTGKTTTAERMFGLYKAEYTDKSVINEMSKDRSVEEITKTFTNVGFSSPPSWLKPYKVLSNGEKMRVDLAKAMLEDKDLIVFDEFTSVVDRDVAKVVSMVVEKTIRKENRQFIAVTCHYDVEEYLQPDWVFDTDLMELRTSKKKDLKLSYKSTKEHMIVGQCLKTIII